MFKNLNTIGKQLFIAFSILALNVIIISVLSYQFNKRNSDIFKVEQRIQTQRIQIVRLLKFDLDFLRFETINPSFYETGTSIIAQRRDSLLTNIYGENKHLRRDIAKFQFDVSPYLDSIENTLLAYNTAFTTIKRKTIERGFKDYGLEGKMRKYAHELENHTSDLSFADLLMMRRHEKDFFLRKEDFYRNEFNKLSAHLIRVINNDSTTENYTTYLINTYKGYFNQLADLDTEIGMTPQQGLLGELNKQTAVISAHLENIVRLSDEQAEDIIKQSLYSSILIGVLLMSVSFVFIYITTIRLTRPIKKLSTLMSRYVFNETLTESDLNSNSDIAEIQNLSGSFILLTRKLKSQFDETSKKSNLLEYRNKELQQLNEELDRFIYSSAHDLKSPLASFDGLVHLVRLEVNNPEHDHYFDKMKKSIDRMNGFIRDITDYAKNKRQHVRVEKIELAGMVEDIFQSLNFLPEMANIQPEIDIDVDDFHTDRTRLEIILKNLLSNAIRYTDLNKLQPRIYVHAKIASDQAIISIEDNGIGIAANHLPRIFDMFYRAVDNAKGSGIGLFLVRESVKMLRGHITVESELGLRTKFVLVLPNLKLINVEYLPESEPIRSATLLATV